MSISATQPGPVQLKLNSLQRVQLGLIFAAYLLLGANSGGFGIILPSFGAFYNLDKGATGLVFLAGTGGFVLAAFVSGWLSEYLGLRNFLLVGLLLFSLACLALGLQPLLGVVLLARLVLGLSVAILEMGGNFFVTALPHNTGLFNYLHAFFGAGALLGPLVATTVLQLAWGWNNLFMLWLGLGLVLGLGLALTFSNSSSAPKPSPSLATTAQDDQARLKAQKKDNSILVVLKIPAVWLAAVFLLVYVGVESSVGSWGYTFLTEGQHYSPVLAGWLVSTYWLGLTLSRLLLGGIIGRLGLAQHDRAIVLGCCAGSLAGAGLLSVVVGQEFVSGFGLLLVGFCFGPIYPTTLAVVARLVVPAHVPNAIALITGLSVGGLAVFPWLAGNLLQLWGSAVLFPFVIVLCVLMSGCGILLFRLDKTPNASESLT